MTITQATGAALDREALKAAIVKLIGDHPTTSVAAAVGVDPAMISRWRKVDQDHVPEVHHINKLIAACGHEPGGELGVQIWSALGAPVR